MFGSEAFFVSSENSSCESNILHEFLVTCFEGVTMPTNTGCSGWFFRHCLWQLLNTAASLRTFRRGVCLARENQGSFFVGGTGEMHGGFDVWWAQSTLFLNQKVPSLDAVFISCSFF